MASNFPALDQLGETSRARLEQALDTFVPGLAPAQVIVVHGRQVIVDQRIGMDQLHSGGGHVGFAGFGAGQLGSAIDQ